MKWSKVPKAVVSAVLERMDGNAIYRPDLLRGLGVPEELVARYVRTFRSNPDLGPTGMLYGHDGKPVEDAIGCHGIEILRDMAVDFGLRGKVCGTHLEGCVIQCGLRKLIGARGDSLEIRFDQVAARRED